MHVIPLPVRVLLNSIEFLITVFICNIYFSECSNYSLIIMVIGNKAYSNGAIAQFPIFIAIFLLITDIIMVGRHIFGETNEYGVIVDYFGKGNDSVWTLLNYDFCIICLQILKYFTVYNYSVLDIYNHKPSIVKEVIKEYDYDLQCISVMNNDDEDQNTNKDGTSKGARKSTNNRKRKQRKYNTKGNFFTRLFRKEKDVDEYDDENALLIVKDDEGDFDNDDAVLIIKDNENVEEEGEEKEDIDIENNNSNDNTGLPINQTESSSSQTPSQIQSQNESYTEAKLIQPSTSSIQSSNSNNNSIPEENKIVDSIEPNSNNHSIEDVNSSTKGKGKGKSPSRSPAMNKGKEAITEDQDDIFFDAYDHISADSSSSHSPAIPLRHVNSSSSNHLINPENNEHTQHQENQDNNNSNEIPIYEIDERERVTEGNENALLYLESYYQFVPVINIKVNEAIQVMTAIRNSNRRFNERAKREERREQREQRRREREQRRREREQSRRSRSSSQQSFDFAYQSQNLVEEPESEILSDQETDISQTQTQNQNQTSTSNSTRSSVVSNQLRSYFNGLHNSFRRSLTGVPPV